MSLPRPGPQYDPENEAVARAAIDIALSQKATPATIYDKIFVRDTVTNVVHTVTIASGDWVIS